MRKYSTSSSPFYDKEFAAQPIKRKGHPTLNPTTAPDRYSSHVGCRDCTTDARIEVRPTKTVYRCPGCQSVLVITYPNAEITLP